MIKELDDQGRNCCIVVCNDGETMISGSDDQMAKVWKNCEITRTCIEGHTSSVLCSLLLDDGFIITGNSDSKIRIFDDKDNLVKTLDDHKGPIRGLANIKDVGFISIANDGKMKFWTYEGEILNSFEPHDNLIYDVIVLSTGENCNFK